MVEKALEVCYSLFKNIDFPAETGRLLGVVESSKGCQETELLSHGRPRGFLAKFLFCPYSTLSNPSAAFLPLCPVT